MGSAAAISYETPLGRGWVAYDGAGLVRLGLPGTHNPYPSGQAPPAAVDLARRLERYWHGGPPLDVSPGMMDAACRTSLDREIYRTVAAIPPGATMTYAEVAAHVGRPGAARAVGAAMAANRFAPAIPCHRVVGSDGSLRGYAGGLDMKRYLLDLEAAQDG